MNNDIAVEILRELWRYKTTDKYTEIEIRRALETAIEAVNGLRPHGEWKEFTVSTYRGTDEFGEPKWGKGKKFVCERCGRRTVIRENFCPDCGENKRKDGETK